MRVGPDYTHHHSPESKTRKSKRMKTTKPKNNPAPRLITNGSNGELGRDELALRAYSLWEQEGHHQNHEVEYWLRAETQLRAERKQNAARA